MFKHAMKYKECPMRNRGYNCDPVGGDCATGISDELCEAIHAAYNKGFDDGVSKAETELLKEWEAERERLVTWLAKFCRHIDNKDRWLSDDESLAFFKEKMRRQFGWNTDGIELD